MSEHIPPRGRLELGDRGRHVITGFTGIVTARCTYLEGCNRVCLTPEDTKEDGSLKEGVYFDEPYVDCVEENVIPPRHLDGTIIGEDAEVVPIRQAGPSTTPGRSATIDPPSR